jgi:hypothetical protein
VSRSIPPTMTLRNRASLVLALFALPCFLRGLKGQYCGRRRQSGHPSTTIHQPTFPCRVPIMASNSSHAGLCVN